MTERFLFELPVRYNPITNEVQEYVADDAIADGTYYTPARMQRFEGKQFHDSIAPPVIGRKQTALLLTIREIITHHATDCRIVINPLYDQIRLNPRDYDTLCRIFGSENVYDFSGPNIWNSDYRLYYEDSHYRPIVARQMMDIIYNK